MKNQNIILTGFMGTGKTTVGRLIAKTTGYRFVDTDDMIVKKAGKRPGPCRRENRGIGKISPG